MDRAKPDWFIQAFRLRPLSTITVVLLLPLVPFLGMAVLGMGWFYIGPVIGIKNSHSEPVEEGGRYYSVGSSFRTEITKWQFDRWQLCNHLAILVFVLNVMIIFIALFLTVTIIISLLKRHYSLSDTSIGHGKRT